MLDMKIGIDIDDTITDTKEAQKNYWSTFVKENKNDLYTTTLPDNINRFGDDYISKFWDTYRDKLFFPKVKENASIVLNKLKEENNIIYIITSRPKEKYKNLIGDLEKSFKENNIPYDYIITNIREKGKYIKDNNLDILVDDDIIHIEQTNAFGKIGILFNENINYDGYKTTSWEELYKIINSIKENNYEEKIK